jgi:hypothetical protein
MKFPGASALLLSLLGSNVALAEPSAAPSAPSVPASSRSFPSATLVVIVSDEPGDVVSARLERDLRSLGLAVMVLQATPENSRDAAALERCARGIGGIAAIHVLPSARGSELFVFEPTTQQTLTRSLTPSAGANAGPNEVALGTLELLRASLLELHPVPTPSVARPAPTSAAPPTPPEPEREPAPRTESSNFSLSGAFAVDLGLRSVGPSLATLWAAWFRIRGCLGGRGFASLPLIAEKGEVPAGTVRVEPLIVGAGLSCSPGSSDSPLWPRGSLGFASARIVTRGTALDPARSHDQTTWLGGGFGMLGLGVRLTRAVHLNLDATCVLLSSPAVIVADQRQVGTWGGPGGLLSVGVEVLALP